MCANNSYNNALKNIRENVDWPTFFYFFTSIDVIFVIDLIVFVHSGGVSLQGALRLDTDIVTNEVEFSVATEGLLYMHSDAEFATKIVLCMQIVLVDTNVTWVPPPTCRLLVFNFGSTTFKPFPVRTRSKAKKSTDIRTNRVRSRPRRIPLPDARSPWISWSTSFVTQYIPDKRRAWTFPERFKFSIVHLPQNATEIFLSFVIDKSEQIY